MSSPNTQHFVGQQPPPHVQQSIPQEGVQNPFQQQSNEEARPENVALEFVSQSSIGANVESAADFFNNMRIGDDPLDGPAYTSSISAFNPLLWAEKMEALRASSVQHANTLTTKQRWEHEAIDMHNGVWRFNNEQRRATGLCGCGNNVVYSYAVRVAALNESLLPLLANKFQDLHHFNIRPVYLSLFEQTTNEMAVTRYLYSCKHLVTGKYNELKVILEQLLGSLSTTTIQGVMSMHTTNVLQTLVQYFGALLLQAAQQGGGNIPSLLLDMGETRVESLPKYAASEFLFKKLLDVKGLSWGCALTHPSIREVVDMSYVVQLFDANLDEMQYAAFLEQINWSEVATLTEAEIIAAFLNPFQKGMEKAVRGNMIKLLLLMSRILVIISHYHPRLTLQALALMTRSPWPSKILTAPLLAALSWGTLAPQELVLVFIELYHLFGKRVEEYAVKTDQDKALHRHSMGHMMLANQHLLTQAYQVDPPLAALNYGVRYPHLALYRRLALYYLRATANGAPDMPDLAGVIMEEMFYFGFVYQGLPVGTGPGPSNPPPPPDLHAWMPYLKNEACVQLSLLCRAAPPLASRLVRLLMQHLAAINIAQVIPFLSQTPTPPLAHFVLTLDALNAISYLITQKTLPATASTDNPQTMDSLISLCIFTPVKTQFPPALAQAGLQLGLKLFDCIRWEQVPPSVRMKAILVILSARHVARDWSWKYLLMTNNRRLTSAPFETAFVHKLFQVDPTQGGDEVLVAHILLALGMADDQYRTSSTGGADWLNKWGLYTKLSGLLDKKRFDLVRALLVPVMQTLKIEPVVSVPHLTNIVVKLLTQDRTAAEGLRRVLVSTLADGSPPESHAQWVQIWAMLLSQRPLVDNHCTMLETLIYGYYCETSGDLLPILPHLSALESNRKNISRFSGKYPFITLSLLHRFTPRLPPFRATKDVDKITKETALWLTKEEAQGIKDPVLALVYWDAFFHFYFGGEPGFEPLPVSTRDALNKHFNSVINSNKSLDETLVSIYYSFNTWRDSILFQNGRIFSNPVAWEALYKILPTAPYLLGPPVPPPALAQQQAQQLFNADYEYISNLSADLDGAKVLALVPLRRTDPMALVESENTRHQAFTQSVSSTLASLSKPDEVKVRAVEDLHKLLRRYNTLKNNLQQEDTEFLQLTRQLYYNHPTTFNVAVPCATQGYCDYPAQIKCPGVNIGPAYPSVREDLQRNRNLFNRDYIALFDVARSIAYIVALLEETVLALVQASGASATAGTNLFFALAPVLLESLPPPNSPIFTALTRVVVTLGDKFVKNHPNLQRRVLQLIISKSVKGGEGALVTIKTGKAFNELRSSVFESFSPVCLLHNNDGLQQYLELLNMFVTSTNGLAPSEDMQIATLFGVPSNFDLIMHNPSTIEAILNMIQPLLCKQSLNPFAIEILTLTINKQFPYYFEPVLERLIILSVQKLITTPWTGLLDPIAPRIASLDEGVALQLLNKTTQHIPAPPPFFSPILFLAHRLLLNAGIVQGILTGRQDYWELVLSCLRAATRPNAVYFPLNSEDFGSVMIFIKDLIVACPVLIDRIWDLFRAIVFPYLHADHLADKSTVIRYLNEIPASTWENATFHTYPATIREMANYLSGDQAARVAGLVCHIMSKLDWSKIAGHIDSVTLLAFLRLYLSSVVIRGSDALGQSAREFARHASWGHIDEDELMREFNGDVFIRLLKDGVLSDEDSSKPILDALKQFFDFADNSGSLPLSAACMREARAFIRASFRSNDSGAYWCIPFPDQVTLVATIIVPLARRATQKRTSTLAQSAPSTQPNPYTREMIVATLSTSSTYWPDTISVPIRYAHDPMFYGDEAASSSGGASKHQEFSRKVDGLVLQFCGSSPTELAISIVQAAIFARLEVNMHMQVLEEALHSYFIHAHSEADQEAEYAERSGEEGQGYRGVPGDKGREILTRAALTITLPPDYPWNEFVEKCIAGQAIITTRVLLENQKLHVANMPALQRIGVATDLVAYAARCIPIATREFDIYSIWFFALDVIQDPRWIRGKRSDEVSKNFQKHLTLFASPSSIQQLLASVAKVGVPQNTPSLNAQLAAKACLLYLERLLTSKKPMKTSNDLRNSNSNIRQEHIGTEHTEGEPGGEAETREGAEEGEHTTTTAGGGGGGTGGGGGERRGEGIGRGTSVLEMNTTRVIGGDDESLLHPEIGSKRDKELFEMAEKFQALRNEPAYAGQDEFFSKMQNILSPLFDFNHFRNTVVRHLAPIALYLEIL